MTRLQRQHQIAHRDAAQQAAVAAAASAPGPGGAATAGAARSSARQVPRTPRAAAGAGAVAPEAAEAARTGVPAPAAHGAGGGAAASVAEAAPEVRGGTAAGQGETPRGAAGSGDVGGEAAASEVGGGSPAAAGGGVAGQLRRGLDAFFGVKPKAESGAAPVAAGEGAAAAAAPAAPAPEALAAARPKGPGGPQELAPVCAAWPSPRCGAQCEIGSVVARMAGGGRDGSGGGWQRRCACRSQDQQKGAPTHTAVAVSAARRRATDCERSGLARRRIRAPRRSPRRARRWLGRRSANISLVPSPAAPSRAAGARRLSPLAAMRTCADGAAGSAVADVARAANGARQERTHTALPQPPPVPRAAAASSPPLLRRRLRRRSHPRGQRRRRTGPRACWRSRAARARRRQLEAAGPTARGRASPACGCRARPTPTARPARSAAGPRTRAPVFTGAPSAVAPSAKSATPPPRAQTRRSRRCCRSRVRATPMLSRARRALPRPAERAPAVEGRDRQGRRTQGSNRRTS